MKDNHVWYHGDLAITHIIHTASVDGPVKRKTPVHYVKKHGQLLRLPNSETKLIDIWCFKFYLTKSHHNEFQNTHNKKSTSSVVYFRKHRLISSHFLNALFETHRFTFISLFILLIFCSFCLSFSIRTQLSFSFNSGRLSKSLSRTFRLVNISTCRFGTSFFIDWLEFRASFYWAWLVICII